MTVIGAAESRAASGSKESMLWRFCLLVVATDEAVGRGRTTVRTRERQRRAHVCGHVCEKKRWENKNELIGRSYSFFFHLHVVLCKHVSESTMVNLSC
jgi:hypothetical protein